MGEPMESIMAIGYEFDRVVNNPLLTVSQRGKEVKIYGHWAQTAYSEEIFNGEVCQYCGRSIDRRSSAPNIEVDSARDHGPLCEEDTGELEAQIDEVLLSVVGFACSQDTCKTRQKQAIARVHQLLEASMSLGTLLKDIRFFSPMPEFKNQPEELIVRLFQSCERER